MHTVVQDCLHPLFFEQFLLLLFLFINLLLVMYFILLVPNKDFIDKFLVKSDKTVENLKW